MIDRARGPQTGTVAPAPRAARIGPARRAPDLRRDRAGRCTAIAFAVGALVAAIVMSVVYTRSEAERQLRERESSDGRRRGGPDRGQTRRAAASHRDLSLRRERPPLHRRREAARGATAATWKHGAPIRIAYLASRPQTNWLTGYEPGGLSALGDPGRRALAAAGGGGRRTGRSAAVDPAVGRARRTGARRRDEEGPPRRAHRVSRQLRIPDAQRREADVAMRGRQNAAADRRRDADRLSSRPTPVERDVSAPAGTARSFRQLTLDLEGPYEICRHDRRHRGSRVPACGARVGRGVRHPAEAGVEGRDDHVGAACAGRPVLGSR